MVLKEDLELREVHELDICVPTGKTLVVRGILNGNVIVESGGSFTLRGIMNGDLVVNQGGTAIIHGILNSDAIVNHGELEVFGIVNANHFPNNVTIHEDAIINGKKY